MNRYRHLISCFRGKRILVIGDVILDQHIRGSVSRISPEAPVPILLQQGTPTFSPGGAANVANNLTYLGAKVTLLGRIGPDDEGRLFLDCLRKGRLSTRGIFMEKNIPTVLKTRIIAQHQQVLRIDRETIPTEEDGTFVKKAGGFIQKNFSKFDAVILSDYGKGMISKSLVELVCSLALKTRKILTVDPKVEHFAYYRRVTGITPNKNEAENAIRNIKITQECGRKLAVNSDCLKTYADVERAGQQLLKFLELESLLITLGEQGMCLLERGKGPVHIRTQAQEVFDVTGAGDTVIAVYTLALTAGATKFEAADLANDAAGIVVGKMGAVPVTREELLEAVKNSETSS